VTRPLRLGTRGSKLAQWQANWVAQQLQQAGFAVEVVLISTTGDQRQQEPIADVGQGVFTKEIQRALLDDQVDLAVHSLKDLPTEPTPGLCLAAVPPRAAVGDALLSREGQTFDQLPQGAVIGTGSSRRRAQLWHRRPDLELRDLRGNVDTRLRKLHDGEFDAIILAEAGLSRLDLHAHITEILPLDWYLPAVGQGALGIETREDDATTRAAVGVLDHADTHAAVLAERALLAGLRAGCLAPVGAWGRVVNGQLMLEAAVLSVDGRQRLTAHREGATGDAAALGQNAAEELIAAGATELIRDARR
jgi:hydroxymethylbilane synthase